MLMLTVKEKGWLEEEEGGRRQKERAALRFRLKMLSERFLISIFYTI